MLLPAGFVTEMIKMNKDVNVRSLQSLCCSKEKDMVEKMKAKKTLCSLS
jgi:hypothetical protein